MDSFLHGENPLKGKKFVASFSGGKDGMLALYRYIGRGLIPLRLITTCPPEGESWFHKVKEATLAQISREIEIPLELVRTSGDEYNLKFEAALASAKADGAEIAIFGDIDIADHLAWCTARCEAANIIPHFPLWQENREALVREFIDSGFKAKITVVRDPRLAGFMDEILTHELLDKIAACGVDVCGENGEYHTLVIDGPIFKNPISGI